MQILSNATDVFFNFLCNDFVMLWAAGTHTDSAHNRAKTMQAHNGNSKTKYLWSYNIGWKWSGLFHKKTKQGGLTFLKKTPGLFRFALLPLEILDKTHHYPWKFGKIVFSHLSKTKNRHLEIPHVFFLIILGKFTSFLIDPWNFCVLFLQYLWKIHAPRKFDLIQIFPYFLSLTKSFSNSWGTQPVYYIFYARISSAPLLVVNGNFLQWNQ